MPATGEQVVTPGDQAMGSPARRSRPTKGSPIASESHVASALRTAYQETVREEVPDEFMDLLGKLA